MYVSSAHKSARPLLRFASARTQRLFTCTTHGHESARCLCPSDVHLFELVVNMLPRVKPCPTKVAERLATPTLDLKQHFLGSGLKPIRNLNGLLTKERIDMKSYEDVTFMFTAESSSVLSRSWTGISYHMARLFEAEKEQQPFVEARILGAHVASLVDQLSEMDSDFGTLNAFSDGADRRTEQEHLSAIKCKDAFQT